MNQELKYVKKWLDANKLALNLEKTNFALFHIAVKKIMQPIVLKFGHKKSPELIMSGFSVFFWMRPLAGNFT